MQIKSVRDSFFGVDIAGGRSVAKSANFSSRRLYFALDRASSSPPIHQILDLALIMTVYPGKGGQSFIEAMMEKVKTLRAAYPNLDIEVDGGVKPNTVDMAAKAGANLIVSGSGVYKADDMAFNISTMQRSIEQYGCGKKDKELSPLVSDGESTKST